MPKLSPSQYKDAVAVGKQLHLAAQSLKVLGSLSWSPAMKSAFLSRQQLPNPEYENVSTQEARDLIASAQLQLRNGFGTEETVISEWLGRLCDTMLNTVNLIDSRGTPEFVTHSTALYGQPKQLMLDRKTMVYDLAKHMDASLDGLDFDRLVVEGAEKFLTDTQFAKRLRARLSRHFDGDAPEVVISPTVSAKAAASSTRIRVRQGAYIFIYL